MLTWSASITSDVSQAVTHLSNRWGNINLMLNETESLKIIG
jgi:hypothetical protein